MTEGTVGVVLNVLRGVVDDANTSPATLASGENVVEREGGLGGVSIGERLDGVTKA